MKKIIPFLLILLLLSGCGASEPQPQIAATTLPVYELTSILTQGTPLTVGRLVTESVSCLHDYSLKVQQVKLVTSIRGNSLDGRISIESPLGKAILGHKVGDRVQVQVNPGYSYEELRSMGYSDYEARKLIRETNGTMTAI